MTLEIPVPEASTEELKRSVAGAERWPLRLRALARLAATDFPGKEEFFGSLLESEKEPPQVRGAAAGWLGRSGTHGALERLVGATRTADPRVLVPVLTALGHTGGIEALDALRTVLARSAGPTARLARFAAALIAHRHGLAGPDLPATGELLPAPAAGRSIEFRRASAEEAAASLRALAREPLGIEYARDGAYHVRCGRSERMILLNREFARPGAAQKLSERKSFIGVVADRDVERGAYFTALLLLSSPLAGTREIGIQLCRPSGEPVLAGSASIAGGKARFQVRAVPRPGGQPVQIDGKFGGDTLEVTTAVAGGAVTPGRAPTREALRA